MNNTKMTYGEAYAIEHDSLKLVNGKWEQTLKVQNKQKRMSREKASKYYNKKLFSYWVKQLDKRVSTLRKHQIISLFMFGNVDKYKILEER